MRHLPRRLSGLSALCSVVLLALLAACSEPTLQDQTIEATTDTAVTPWTGLKPLDDPQDFQFAIVSDRTCCARPGVFAAAMPKINQVGPAFVLSVGDLIEGYTENQRQLNKEWDEIEAMVAQLDAPFFYTPGNHDMNNAIMAEEWQRRFGPSYYHFSYKDVLFLVINSELFGMVGAPDTPLPGPWAQADQMEFIRSVLAQHTEARWTFVLLHQPLWDNPNIDEDWLEVETLLGERKYTVFAGHFHQYSRARRHDRNYITLATTGGGSGLRGPTMGEFDHIAWVTMRAEGPTIANLVLDGILDEDVSNPEVLAGITAIVDGIRIEPNVADEPLFTSTSQKVTINNPTDQPMTISGRAIRATSFDIDGLLPLTIEPGESKELFIQLTSQEPVPYSDLTTAGIQWTVTGNVSGRVVQFPILKPVLPLTKHTITRRADIVVDGDLSEWQALRFNATNQGDIEAASTEAADISLAFDVVEGTDALYIGIRVMDDNLQTDPDLIPRMQDSVRIFVDPRDPDLRDQPMGAGQAVLGGDMAAQIATILPLGEHTRDELLAFIDDTNANIDYKISTTEEGYVVEVSIPLAYIADKSPEGVNWREARIAIGAYDLDEGDHGPVALHWRPYRHGSTPLPGSGTFRRGD